MDNSWNRMNRRAFLESSVAAALVSSLPSAFAGPEHKLSRIGLQLYTVRTIMKSDFFGTLAKVAATGYTEVEFGDYFNLSPREVRAAIDKFGLVSPSRHIDYKTVISTFPEALDAAHTIGHKFLVNPWIDDAVREHPDGWKQAAEVFNRAGEAAKKAGIQFAYHNHSFEFKPMANGTLPYDFLLKACDPQLVAMEMDLCWVNVGGADPIQYFNQYPGRFPLVHVKDVKKFPKPLPIEGATVTVEQVVPDMTEVGSGIIDWKHIFAQSGNAGIQHYYVEHDKPADPIASIQKSFQYLSALRF
jgi:sugar phosphate isomerase/epimerase